MVRPERSGSAWSQGCASSSGCASGSHAVLLAWHAWRYGLQRKADDTQRPAGAGSANATLPAEKAMLFPLDDGESATAYESVADHEVYVPDEHPLRQQIVKSADLLGELGGVTLRPLDPGKLFTHGSARMLTMTQAMQLAALGRVVHDRHFNPAKYAGEPERERLYVPGANRPWASGQASGYS